MSYPQLSEPIPETVFKAVRHLFKIIPLLQIKRKVLRMNTLYGDGVKPDPINKSISQA
jgi:hypothetical protein